MKLNHSITDIPGIRVGHAQDDQALTGCTVVLCEGGAVGGVDQRGGAPGTRETDALHTMHLVRQVHAVVLSGGSAFGLDSASGVVRYLEKRDVGFDVRVAKVPIVPAAILFDLSIGRADIRPDAQMGYQACLNASSDPITKGNVGAGTGSTVGKILGMNHAMKSGIGDASIEICDGIVVAAIMAVNAFGDVVDPSSGKIIAGVRSSTDGNTQPRGENDFAGTINVMKSIAGKTGLRFGRSESTVIGVVATNAGLDKEQANVVAQMAQDGIARTIYPAHTMFDGDTIFALALGGESSGPKIDVNIIGAFAAKVCSQAIIEGVKSARSAGGLPAAWSGENQ